MSCQNWPYMNLARLYLYSAKSENDINRALELAERAKEINEDDFFCKVHKEKIIFDETWSVEQIKSVKKDLNVYEAAFTELGYLEEGSGNLVEASRWF